VQQNCLLRHIDVCKCPFGALGFFLFYRFHIREDIWPSFEDAANWYDIHVLPLGIQGTKPMTYSKQYTTIKKAQEVIFFAKY
jgi:hypothetical protein